MENSMEKMNESGEANRIEPAEEVGFNCLENLPEEMWRELMEKLDGDYDSLLNCRRVSPEMKIIAEDELATQATWSMTPPPHFYHGGNLYRPADYRNDDSYLFLQCITGTHITKVEDVEKFIAANQIINVGSHFPNGCVIFYPEGNLEGFLPFYNSLETLVNTFGADITTLIYQLHCIMDSTQFTLQLSLILKLKNLKQLSIYFAHCKAPCCQFRLEPLNKLFQDGIMKITVTTGLRKLHLREYPPNNNNLPLMTVFKNFLPDWKHLDYLSFNWNNSIDMGEITEQILKHPPPPKLKDLEIQDPSLQLLQYFCLDSVEVKDGISYPKPAPRLKNLAVHYNQGANTFTTFVHGYSREESRVIQLFNTLDAKQTDLEMLCLDMFVPPEFEARENPLPLNFAVKFAKLTELRFNYVTLLRWESLLEILSEKMPNLGIITVECSYDCMRVLNEFVDKIVGVYLLVCSLWEIFPTVNSILVPYYQWELEKGQKPPQNVMEVAENTQLF